ncbi:MAG: peptide chain release factor N(5)-glutamine methyltransferase [Lachnospiraceae bacterium]|jgi:release factor glutamine methyltransferase
MKLREYVAAAADRLRKAGVPEPENDAWLLFSDSFGMDRTQYILDSERDFTPDPGREKRFADRMAQRERRIPLQRILQVQNFFGLDLAVRPDVLIPRGDTEILAEQVLLWSEKHPGGRFLDLCTGSGCVAAAVGRFGRFDHIAAADLSGAAVSAAAENTKRCGVQAELFQGDLFEPVQGKFDAIASNPPYIESGAIASLEPEVSRYEPAMALDGGADGLDFYRRIAAQGADYLTGNGALFLEIDGSQSRAVSELLEKNRFGKIRVVKDYAGIDRVVTAERQS